MMRARKCGRQGCKYFVPSDVAYCCIGCRDVSADPSDPSTGKHSPDCIRRLSRRPFLEGPLSVEDL